MRNLPGRCHELKGDREGQLAIDLNQPYRIIFEPVGEELYKDDGGLDWNLVKSIRILSIEDYHG
jgi:proteic killer suppression protein